MYKQLLQNPFGIYPFLVFVLTFFAASSARSDIFGVPSGGLVGIVHGQPVEADTLRVTLSGMHRFVVTKKGEKRNKGELTSIFLSLSSNVPGVVERYERVFEPHFFFNETSRKDTGSHPYLKIGKNDIVRVRPQRTGDRINDFWINLPPGGRFTILLIAHESDCLKDRACNRGDKGRYGVQMTLPALPNPLPTSCGASNTFRWGQLDARYQLFGMRDVRIAEKGSVRLYPIQGTICITPAR